MPSSYTPLRYPGGKAKLGPFLGELFRANAIIGGIYAEPYAGGAGAALHLLFRGFASKIFLNDLDTGVAAFWRAILNHNDRFAEKIERVSLNVDEWDRQREIYREGHAGFDLGFAFFYLNRTNRSGIMNGGIIGGRDQSGEWGIDARFNRTDLASRVRAIGTLKRSITVTRKDALTFLDSVPEVIVGSKGLVYLDPPYYAKGPDLYPNFYSHRDHRGIAKYLKRFSVPWLLTYDDCAEIRQMYQHFDVRESELSYSAREVRRGRELVVASKGLIIPNSPKDQKRRGKSGFQLLAVAG
jgi:DNA adenine methylase